MVSELQRGRAPHPRAHAAIVSTAGCEVHAVMAWLGAIMRPRSDRGVTGDVGGLCSSMHGRGSC